MTSNEVHEPIFIICTGRSGSTLLRYILDCHPDIDAPQELHLGPMIKESIRITRLLHEDKVSDPSELEALIKSEVKSQVDTMIRASLKSKIWCDKSVSSIDYLDEIMYVFPKAKYIFLYRDCMDFVHSALEVSKYGFEGFWFEDYILKSPKNIVDGLVNFWCMQAEKRISIHKDSDYNIYPVKYEDIVHQTIPTLELLFKFLDFTFDASILENIFASFKPGSGDLKVQSSNKINDNTGKGRMVPLKHVKPESFVRMNKALQKLGYPTVDNDFNFSGNGPGCSEANSKEINDFLSSCIHKKQIPLEVKGKQICFVIKGLKDSPWRVDLDKNEIIKNYPSESNGALEFKMNVHTMLAMMHGQMNISMSYREGLIKTNASYKELNEIGKFIFN